MIRSRWRRGAPIAAAAGALAACSLLVPLDEQQCTASSDCAARGGAFVGAACVNHVCVTSSVGEAAADGGGGPDPWACLDLPSEVPTLAPVTITFKVFDALSPITTAGPQGGSDFTVLSFVPVPGIAVEACNALDPSCEKAIASGGVTDDAGEATVSVPDNFHGFFQFLGVAYLPEKVYVGNMLADASTFQPPVALLGTQETSLLAGAIGVTMQVGPDAGVGHAFMTAYDCNDRLAPGVSFSVSVDGGSQMVGWYATNNAIPSTTQNQTGSLGTGGIVNVPVGAVIVTATLAATKRPVASVNTVVAPGWITFSWVRARSH